MPLNTQDFNTLVSNEIAAAQASSSSLLDFSQGSVLLSMIQANVSSIGLWLQGLDTYILALTRAATSTGADLDSWMADFGFTRLPATAASGNVTFSRLNNTSQAVVPVGAIVQTANGTVSFTAILDTTNVNYNAALGGYVLTSGTSSINVVVQANIAGTIGNAATNAISVINTPIPYVDTVTNSSSFSNGVNAETDAAFRARFVVYLASLSKATIGAIGYAVSQVQGVVDYTITQNVNYSNVTQYGYFYVVVDDGTGSPSGQLISNVSNAVDAVRGATIMFGVFAPVIVYATVVMTVTAAPGYLHSALAPIVQAAITAYINGLTLGTTLYYTQLIQVAYNASPGVLDVSSYTLNSGTSDIAATAQEIIKSLSVTIN